MTSNETELRNKINELEFKINNIQKAITEGNNYIELQTKNTVKKELKSMKDNGEFYPIFSKAIFDRIHEILSLEILNSYLQKRIQEEVERIILNTNVSEIVKNFVKKYITEDKLNLMINLLLPKIFNTINKRFSDDLKRTKQLTYSIDKEIQHLSMRNGFSEEVDKIVKKHINRFLLIDSSISIKHIPQHSKADSSQ